MCLFLDCTHEQCLPLEVTKHLGVSEELAKVNMKHVTSVLDHDVVVVTVADAQEIGGDTIASA